MLLPKVVDPLLGSSDIETGMSSVVDRVVLENMAAKRATSAASSSSVVRGSQVFARCEFHPGGHESVDLVVGCSLLRGVLVKLRCKHVLELDELLRLPRRILVELDVPQSHLGVDLLRFSECLAVLGVVPCGMKPFWPSVIHSRHLQNRVLVSKSDIILLERVHQVLN